LRYFFHIAYRGNNYSGWQRHKNANTVQQIIEEAFGKVLKYPVAINGCGRTDAGVNASQYFFHADIENEWDFDLKFRLNRLLPEDIAIFDIIPMQGLPHARFDATQRTYNYFIHTEKDPFLSAVSSFYQLDSLDFDKMKLAVALLPKYNDYRALCTTPDKNEHTICHVSQAELYSDSTGKRIRFQVSSNRFLSKMIRIITGKLLKIGTGKLSIDEFENHLITLQTPKTLDPAYPQGLYLSKIVYPYLDLKPNSDFINPVGNINEEFWRKL